MLSPIARGIRSALEYSPVSVDTFFVLSGFLIGGILLRAKESANYYRTFYVRRAFRILPLYYSWLALCLVFVFFAPGWGIARPTGYSPALVAGAFVFFFHNFVPAIARSSLIASPTWTLAVEEHFYLVAPTLVRKLSERRLTQVLVGVVGGAPLFRGFLFKTIGHGMDWVVHANYMWTFCRVDALAMGVLLAVFWTSPEKRARLKALSPFLLPCLFALTALGWMGQFLNDRQVPHTFTLAAALGRTTTELACAGLMLLVLTQPDAAIGRFLRSSFMREAGKISYCLYLVHWGVLWMLTRFVFHTQFGISLKMDLVLAAVSLVLSIGVSKLSLRYIEEPLIRRGHRYSY